MAPVRGIRRLLRTRAYWWGEQDSEEGFRQATLPNLEVPAVGLKARWYKYMFCGAHTNMPLTRELVGRVREALAPALPKNPPICMDLVLGTRSVEVWEAVAPFKLVGTRVFYDLDADECYRLCDVNAELAEVVRRGKSREFSCAAARAAKRVR